MTDGTRRTIAELITLYELEPRLSEVLTEGRTDSAVVLWFLRRGGSDAAVYCISDRLDVPAAEVRHRGWNVGNKGRVIAAAQKLSEESSSTAERVTFVYDLDDDVIAGRPILDLPCLLPTDYTSIEMYCFALKPVDKLLKVTLRASDDIKADTVLDAIRGALIAIAFARFILSQITPPVAMITTIERRCQLVGESLTVNTRALIGDSVSTAGGARALGVDIDTLVASQEVERANCTEDARLVIRGHDFTRICCYFLKTRFSQLFRNERIPYKTPSVFETALLTCLEIEQLMPERLFQLLWRRHVEAP